MTADKRIMLLNEAMNQIDRGIGTPGDPAGAIEQLHIAQDVLAKLGLLKSNLIKNLDADRKRKL